jgi:D-alanyl-D-alanine carboxypeptidase
MATNLRTMSSRELVWENTNKLLARKDCLGVKTGYTPIAGACLAANFHTQSHHLILVIIFWFFI